MITSRCFLVVVGVLLLTFATTVAYAERGLVSHRLSGCDWFLVDAPSGYVLMEWYGGHDPDKGDRITGSFSEYGLKDVYDLTADEELQVYIEDYMLDKEDALEQLYDQCE